MSFYEFYDTYSMFSQMVPGFLEAESLELLASSVGMHPSEVWPQAKEIHRKAYGEASLIVSKNSANCLIDNLYG